jgi:hypothetical protein
MADRPRIIVALSDLTECATVADWLVADGFEPLQRPSPGAAREEMQSRGFDLLIADDTLAFRGGLITAGRARNPLTPTVVIGDAEECTSAIGRDMYLARPVEPAMLACTVSMAIAEGRPVRRSERKPVNRFDAIVNGVPSHIIDLSNEGLCLEMPRDRRTVPPPYFDVRIPLIGVTVTVQRMWAKPRLSNGRTETTLCGGALAQNKAKVEQSWRAFVHNVPGGTPPSLEVQ